MYQNGMLCAVQLLLPLWYGDLLLDLERREGDGDLLGEGERLLGEYLGDLDLLLQPPDLERDLDLEYDLRL